MSLAENVSTGWSLHVSDKNATESPSDDVTKSVIWTSSTDSSYPTVRDLSHLLSAENVSPLNISDLAAQIVRNAPVTAVGNLLDCLSCHYHRKGSSIDVRLLENLPNANRRAVCGKVFNKGEIVWTCRTCAKDLTSVQCDECFKHSDHTDHELSFHRASGRGGCCDCGDPEAWLLCGNCTEHSCGNQCEIDPLSVIPEELLNGFGAVVSGVVGIMVSYATGTVRGFEAYADNCYIKEGKRALQQNKEPFKIKLRLHNDDMHTYEEVTEALIAIDFSGTLAQATTVAVDQEGEAIVFTGDVDNARIENASRVLSDERGLLSSITPEVLANMTPNISAAFQWLVASGNSNDGLMRVVTNALLQDVVSLPSCAIAAELVGVPPPNKIFEKLTRLSGSAEPVKAPFPQSIQHLRDRVAERLVEDEMGRTMRTSPFSVCPHNALAIIVMASPYLCPGLSKAINDLAIRYQQDLKFKASFAQVMALLYPALSGLYFRAIGLRKETVFSTTVQVFTADSLVTMLSSEGVDERPLIERRDFLKISTAGADKILTSPLTRSNASAEKEKVKEKGEGKSKIGTNYATRPLANIGDPLNLMETLSSTFLTLLADVGCTADREDDQFVNHHSIRSRRFEFLFHDLEYCSDNPWTAIKTLQGIRDGRVIDDWLEICTLLQCVYKFRRRTGTHMEQEDDTWQDAANLVLELESVSSSIMCNALLAPITPYDALKGASVSTFVCTENSDISDVSLHRRFAVGVALDKAFFAMACWFNTHLLHPSAFCSEDQDLFFNGDGATCPIAVLGFAVDFPGIRRYTVSHSPVSVHLPIHRFISKTLDFAANADLDLSDVITRLIPTLAFSLADFPMRCLSFCSQVRNGMWRRNGSMPESLVYNYDRTPLCKTLRNSDLTSIQTAILVMGPDTTLALAIDRFELTPLLDNFTDPTNTLITTDKLLEYRGLLLADLLKTIVLLMTYLPVSLVYMETSQSEKEKVREEREKLGQKEENKICKISRALKRELSHLLLSSDHPMTLSNLQAADSMIGDTNMVTDKMMRAAVQDLCDKREDVVAGKKTLDPKQVAFDMFDPEYLNLSSQQQQLAIAKVKEHRKKASSSSSSSASSASVSNSPQSVPLILLAAIPAPHPEYLKARRMLFQPLTLKLLETSLKCCMVDTKILGISISSIIKRVVHIATLQLHCQAEVAAMDRLSTDTAADTPTTGPKNPNSDTNAHRVTMTAKELSHLKSTEKEKSSERFSTSSDIQIQSPIAVSKTDSSGKGAAGCFFDLFFSPRCSDKDTSASAVGVTLSSSSSTTAGQHSALLISKFKGAGVLFLTALADIWLAGTIRDDEYYQQGMSWVLKELSEKSTDAKNLLLQKGITFEFAQPALTGNDAMAKRRLEAQRRAVSAMTKQAASFATAAMDDDDGEEGMDGQPLDSTATPSLEDGAPECIVCREKSGEAMGYLAFLQTSSVIKGVIQRHSDCKEMQSVYRVVANGGCTITQHASKTSKSLAHVPHGGHVLVGSRAGRWMRIVSPTPGWVPIYQSISPTAQKMGSDPSESDGYQRLLYEKPGAPIPTLKVNLHPVSDLQFNHFGGDRVHVSSCGHAMHLKCHMRVVDTIHENDRMRSNLERTVDLRRGEVLCPLCKCISNTILPHTPTHIAATRLPLTGPPAALSPFHLPPTADRCLSSLLTATPKKAASEMCLFVGTLLTPKGLRDSGVKGPGPTPVTTIFSDLDGAVGSASSDQSTSPAAAYDKIIADRWFQRDVLTLFVPLWLSESAIYSQRLGSLIDCDMVRSTYSVWASASYTLLCASRAKSWLDPISSPTDLASSSVRSTLARPSGVLDLSRDEKLVNLIYQLLLYIRTVNPALYKHNQELLHSGITDPLCNLLSGLSPPGETYNDALQMERNRNGSACSVCTNPHSSEVRSALLSQPLASVGTVAFPDAKRQTAIIRKGENLIARAVADTRDPSADIRETDLWPYFRTPLLEHDLHIVAIAVVSTAVDVPSAVAVLPLLCLARLAQILIEPAAAGVAVMNSIAAQSLLKADACRSKCRTGEDKDTGHIHGKDKDKEKAKEKEKDNYIGKGDVKSSDKFCPPRVMVADDDSVYPTIEERTKNDACRTSPETTDATSGVSRKREREEGRVFHLEPTPLDVADQLYNLQKGLFGSLSTECPSSSSSSPSSSSSSSSSSCSNEDSSSGLDRLDLLASVVDSWLPYIDYCLSLRTVLLSKSPPTVGKKDSAPIVSEEGVSALCADLSYLVCLLRSIGLCPHDSVDNLPATTSACRDMQHFLEILSSPGLAGIFNAWSSQAARNTCTPAVTSSSAWISGMGMEVIKATGAAVITERGDGEDDTHIVATSTLSNINNFNGTVPAAISDTISVDDDDIDNIDDTDDAAGPSSDFDGHLDEGDESDGEEVSPDGLMTATAMMTGNYGDVDDTVDPTDWGDWSNGESENGDADEDIYGQSLGENLSVYGSSTGDIDVDVGGGDDDDSFGYEDGDDDFYADEDDEGEGEGEGNGDFEEISLFEQQVATFLIEHPLMANGLPNDVASVMQHMGMQPGEQLPHGLAAMIEAFQMPPPSGSRTQPEAGARVVWRMLGVDPLNLHVDAHHLRLYSNDSSTVHTMCPLRGSVTGRSAVYGVQGERLQNGFNDLSHFGLGNRHRGGFISLPLAYTDLHQMTTFPNALPGQTMDAPAVCLLCGQILNSGIRTGLRGTNLASDSTPPFVGECTLHARGCGSGVGVFFLVYQCSVLLMRGSRSCYYPSIYLDQNGDEPETSGKMYPMFLSLKSVKELEDKYLNHQIAVMVTRRMASQERVNQPNWF